ncbi:hypothetical protein DFH08DRAFT_828387 [Mycena albidolilacea]|uniref:Uncharacterized protein n=1 Tax=Mycena albidolilacea TaxID=1033008 RepID=A0AAD7E683_9AGAR|nr:hypothetical protein DFH08DRAFT_828387 [Mycena albidolilacea]
MYKKVENPSRLSLDVSLRADLLSSRFGFLRKRAHPAKAESQLPPGGNGGLSFTSNGRGPVGMGADVFKRSSTSHNRVALAVVSHGLQIRGSKLVQKYIGEGSRMVPELSPSMIFKDEIDSIGSSQGERECWRRQRGAAYDATRRIRAVEEYQGYYGDESNQWVPLRLKKNQERNMSVNKLF